MSETRWQLSIDTGGTFTDCLAVDPRGELRRLKVLSSGKLRVRVAAVLDEGRRLRLEGLAEEIRPGLAGQLLSAGHQRRRIVAVDAPASELALDHALELAPGQTCEIGGDEEAPLLAARLLTGTPRDGELPPLTLRLATTRGTNALLERKGAPVVLFITRGFGDLLELRDQQRPDLFALNVQKVPPLAQRVVEVDERLDAQGAVLRPLDEDALRERAEALVADGAQAAAVALVHADRHPRHEQRAAEILREAGFGVVRASAEVSPRIGLLGRADTAIVDATLTPIIERFLGGVDEALPAERRFLVMTSAGGLSRAERYAARESLLSGPAGGVVGAAAAARACGFDKAIAFDMGGTSTDVARWAGAYDYRSTQQIGDARLNATALAIESVAAGGGSICQLVDGRLAVGPESAGAAPGPACYGAGGPLTITDVNLLLGRFDVTRFALPVDRAAAERALEALRAQLVAESSTEGDDREALLSGLLALANERMAEAIRKVSLRRGYDPAEHALVAFGGAGPQHATAVAERLGVTRVVVPEEAGLLSARGLSRARIERVVERQLLGPLDELAAQLHSALDEATADAREAVAEEGVPAGEIVVLRRQLELRFVGQDTTLVVDLDGEAEANPTPARVGERFAERYRALYGYEPRPRPLELVALRVIAASPEAVEGAPDAPAEQRAAPASEQALAMWTDGSWRDVACHDRARLEPGMVVDGPAAIIDPYCTTIVGAGWRAEVHGSGALLLTREAAAERDEARADDARADDARGAERYGGAARQEIHAHRLASIAEQMGELLQRTALSTNIKERLDFSCALLDREGKLVVNAPHIPVHLGSLGLCVREVLRRLPLERGDVVVTNHPAAGGSHLPDITLIAPAHAADGTLLGYLANRAHHAELGGTRPGSMPPDARSLAEEGVVIAPRYLARAGEARWDELAELLAAPPYPSRAVEENLADLAAQLAAASYGCRALAQLADEIGGDAIAATMSYLEALAAEQARRALARLPARGGIINDRLDDGSPLRVRVELDGPRAIVDLRGSAPVHPGNLNATPAIVRSAVLYALRLLIERPLPLNEGLLEPVEILLEEGIFAPPFPDDPALAPAVVGGNVETSQRLVNALLAALGVMAYSQGTMNNLLFGDERFGFYETICGGVGATETADGASGVHSHMTNTRCTDVEVLERRYPVRLERFCLRRGSGGAGRRRGGDGVIRELTFLAPLEISLLGQHRAEGPRGLAGGSAGQPAQVTLIGSDGAERTLGAIDGARVGPGDRLRVATPGGGGYGAARSSA